MISGLSNCCGLSKVKFDGETIFAEGMMKPVPGIVEFKVSPGVWLQLFEAGSEQTAGHTLRFLVDDMEKAQASRSENQINTGEAIEIPGVVIYSEFSDPFGNALGFYEIP